MAAKSTLTRKSAAKAIAILVTTNRILLRADITILLTP
jgi:hypothetical protein